MTHSPDEQQALAALEQRIKTLLPSTYQDCYEEVQPVSMGSASLKYGADGKVAWNEIWGSFCDLAMAGGPPHKGTLLEPGTAEAIGAEPGRYQEVVDEICRGLRLVTSLPVEAAETPGWVGLQCADEKMASWLLRAILMENVSARAEGRVLLLPAGPAYRVEKEIKNVITSTAKTCHYWVEHTWPAQVRAIGALFEEMAVSLPLVVPGRGGEESIVALGVKIEQLTGLKASAHRYDGWLGVECATVAAAVWMMRALVASNVLARREGTVLFVPVNAATDPQGETVGARVAEIYRFAMALGRV
jgi:sirohydrochlorin cobaltochelatase